MSKHSVTIHGLRVVTTCWSWAWSNRTSPSKWVGLGSPLAACLVYGDLICSVHAVSNLCTINSQCHFYLCNRGPYVRLTFVPNMLSSWSKDIIIIIMISGLKLCGPIQTSLTGTLASVDEGLNGYYDDIVICTWKVLVQSYDKKIQLYFLDMVFQHTGNCQQDFVKVVLL